MLSNVENEQATVTILWQLSFFGNFIVFPTTASIVLTANPLFSPIY